VNAKIRYTAWYAGEKIGVFGALGEAQKKFGEIHKPGESAPPQPS
jgi:hypothetical protein